MKKTQNSTLNDVIFLITGLILVSLGYSSLASDDAYLASSNSKWWAFGATLLGGLMLGKWLSDYFTAKLKKK